MFFGHVSDIATPEAGLASGVWFKGLLRFVYLVAGTRNQRYLQALQARVPTVPRPLMAATPVRTRGSRPTAILNTGSARKVSQSSASS